MKAANLFSFPRFRGVTVEIGEATIIFESDGSVHDGFDVCVVGHPEQGNTVFWYGLTFEGAKLEADELLKTLPGAVLVVSCDHDDPDGGGESIKEAA